MDRKQNSAAVAQIFVYKTTQARARLAALTAYDPQKAEDREGVAKFLKALILDIDPSRFDIAHANIALFDRPGPFLIGHFTTLVIETRDVLVRHEIQCEGTFDLAQTENALVLAKRMAHNFEEVVGELEEYLFGVIDRWKALSPPIERKKIAPTR